MKDYVVETTILLKLLVCQHYTHNSNQFARNVYQTQDKSLTRLVNSSRRKYETGIASLATPNPKVIFAHV